MKRLRQAAAQIISSLGMNTSERCRISSMLRSCKPQRNTRHKQDRGWGDLDSFTQFYCAESTPCTLLWVWNGSLQAKSPVEMQFTSSGQTFNVNSLEDIFPDDGLWTKNIETLD